MIINRRQLLHGGAAAVGLAATTALRRPQSAAANTSRGETADQSHPSGMLTNLAHLDSLFASIRVAAIPGHTTYRIAQEPDIGVVWVYANFVSGHYVPTGGGAYDTASNTYGQGAYDADDISRAAVVYIRHWTTWHDEHSRRTAYQLLRGLTYLQTMSGADAGNVVLWMQPDGSLNPTPTPPDTPNPSDSDASWWMGRTLWALGEGYAAFRQSDAAFASFLAERFELSRDALLREVLDKYGSYDTVNGQTTPRWLLSDGADASSEACLGLAAHARATGDRKTTLALSRLAEGIGSMSRGTAVAWPFCALMQDARNLSLWHAYGDQLACALAQASDVLGQPHLLTPALHYGLSFASHLLVQGGPDNEWLPSPVGAAGQISYGAYCVLADLVELATVTGKPVFDQLAIFAGSWWFGNNRGQAAMYDATTGVCYDGVTSAGPNRNSGAESTICAQLAMMLLDTHPDIGSAAQTVADPTRTTWTEILAASGQLVGAAHVIESAPTGSAEAQWGGSYVTLGAGGAVDVDLTLTDVGGYRLFPVLDMQPSRGSLILTQALGSAGAGNVDAGRLGEQGAAYYADQLVVAPAREVQVRRGGPSIITGRHTAGDEDVPINAWLLQPSVERLTIESRNGSYTLIRSFADHDTMCVVIVPTPGGHATTYVYDTDGSLDERITTHSSRVHAPVRSHSITVVEAA